VLKQAEQLIKVAQGTAERILGTQNEQHDAKAQRI
jgi:hypothetical protein